MCPYQENSISDIRNTTHAMALNQQAVSEAKADAHSMVEGGGDGVGLVALSVLPGVRALAKAGLSCLGCVMCSCHGRDFVNR